MRLESGGTLSYGFPHLPRSAALLPILPFVYALYCGCAGSLSLWSRDNAHLWRTEKASVGCLSRLQTYLLDSDDHGGGGPRRRVRWVRAAEKRLPSPNRPPGSKAAPDCVYSVTSVQLRGSSRVTCKVEYIVTLSLESIEGPMPGPMSQTTKRRRRKREDRMMDKDEIGKLTMIGSDN